jgi:hypothetical protein
MTEPVRKTRRPGPLPVVGGSLAAFMALFGFMAYQLRTGHDPALGAPQAAQPAPVKRVVVKRVERRVIITTLVPPKEEDDGPQAAISVPAVVVQRAPAVVSAPALAPAPTPAPIVTRASGA